MTALVQDIVVDHCCADVLDEDIWNYYLLSTGVKLLFMDDDKNEGSYNLPQA